MELVEAFCSEHNVSFDEVLYEWPASKFEGIYAAFSKRKIADDLNHRRNLEMASILTAQFEKTDDLTEALDKIDSSYSKAIAGLYGETEEEDDIDYDDPFFAAMKNSKDTQPKLPDPKMQAE